MPNRPAFHLPSFLSWLASGPSLRSGLPVRIGLLGLATGLSSACVISVNDGDWGDAEQCYESYDDCLEDAFPFGHDAIEACEALLDSCIEACDDKADSGNGETGGEGGDPPSDTGAGDGDGDTDPRPSTTGDGDGDGDSTTGDGDSTTGDGDGDGPDPACFELYGSCVADAETLQDIDACEALFDNCVNPGPCDSPECEPGCPQHELDLCVGSYADCAAAASTEAEVLVCEDMFDDCIAQFDVSECLPNYDDALLAACLDQHALCIACADTPEEIAACQATFDNCLEG